MRPVGVGRRQDVAGHGRRLGFPGMGQGIGQIEFGIRGEGHEIRGVRRIVHIAQDDEAARRLGLLLDDLGDHLGLVPATFVVFLGALGFVFAIVAEILLLLIMIMMGILKLLLIPMKLLNITHMMHTEILFVIPTVEVITLIICQIPEVK